ncbi:MAG: hypothetical protein M1826_003275 [Phylliscum demangeonii]|nr:MAG: hypothetical protein M1826_003275 [Phylliscum demangeonii]
MASINDKANAAKERAMEDEPDPTGDGGAANNPSATPRSVGTAAAVTGPVPETASGAAASPAGTSRLSIPSIQVHEASPVPSRPDTPHPLAGRLPGGPAFRSQSVMLIPPMTPLVNQAAVVRPPDVAALGPHISRVPLPATSTTASTTTVVGQLGVPSSSVAMGSDGKPLNSPREPYSHQIVLRNLLGVASSAEQRRQARLNPRSPVEDAVARTMAPRPFLAANRLQQAQARAMGLQPVRLSPMSMAPSHRVRRSRLNLDAGPDPSGLSLDIITATGPLFWRGHPLNGPTEALQWRTRLAHIERIEQPDMTDTALRAHTQALINSAVREQRLEEDSDYARAELNARHHRVVHEWFRNDARGQEQIRHLLDVIHRRAIRRRVLVLALGNTPPYWGQSHIVTPASQLLVPLLGNLNAYLVQSPFEGRGLFRDWTTPSRRYLDTSRAGLASFFSEPLNRGTAAVPTPTMAATPATLATPMVSATAVPPPTVAATTPATPPRPTPSTPTRPTPSTPTRPTRPTRPSPRTEPPTGRRTRPTVGSRRASQATQPAVPMALSRAIPGPPEPRATSSDHAGPTHADTVHPHPHPAPAPTASAFSPQVRAQRGPMVPSSDIRQVTTHPGSSVPTIVHNRAPVAVMVPSTHPAVVGGAITAPGLSASAHAPPAPTTGRGGPSRPLRTASAATTATMATATATAAVPAAAAGPPPPPPLFPHVPLPATATNPATGPPENVLIWRAWPLIQPLHPSLRGRSRSDPAPPSAAAATEAQTQTLSSTSGQGAERALGPVRE